MYYKKTVGIGLCCLFLSFILPYILHLLRVLIPGLFDITNPEEINRYHTIGNCLALLTGIFGMAIISRRHSFFRNSNGQIAGLSACLIMLLYFINNITWLIHPDNEGSFLYKNALIPLGCSAIFCLCGIYFLFSLKTWKWIKCIGYSTFVLKFFINGFIMLLIQNSFAELRKADSYGEVDKILEHLQHIYNIESLFAVANVAVAIVCIILTIVWMCRKSHNDDLYRQGEPTEGPTIEGVGDNSLATPMYPSYSKLYLGMSLLSLFSYFLLFAYIIYKTLIEPINNGFSSLLNNDSSDYDFTMLAVSLIFIAAIFTFIASISSLHFKHRAGQFFGFVTSILMGICAYFMSAVINHDKLDIDSEAFVTILILLGVSAIIYLALINIENGKGIKTLGFVSLGLYLALIVLCIVGYKLIVSAMRNSFYYGESSLNSAEGFLTILKVCGIGCVLCLLGSLVLSIINLFNPKRAIPD